MSVSGWALEVFGRSMYEQKGFFVGFLII